MWTPDRPPSLTWSVAPAAPDVVVHATAVPDTDPSWPGDALACGTEWTQTTWWGRTVLAVNCHDCLVALTPPLT